jgi:hypothetical protein
VLLRSTSRISLTQVYIPRKNAHKIKMQDGQQFTQVAVILNIMFSPAPEFTAKAQVIFSNVQYNNKCQL